MVRKPTVLDRPRQLVCEGDADREFFRLLLSARGMAEHFQIHAADGKDNVGNVVAALLGARGCTEVRSVVVAIDSDDDPARRVTETCGQIQAACGPALALPEGALRFSTGVPALALALVPWPDRPGCLESLLWEIAFRSDAAADARACVDGFVECVGSTGWHASKRAKQRWHALVAGANEQDPGRATTWLLKRQPELFDFKHPLLDPLAHFFASVV